MKLYIAEKPSLGRAIAAALPKPQKNQQGYIDLPNGDKVTWCIGHILEQAQPEAYDEKYKKWQFDHLPILPKQWLLKAKSQTKAQLAVIRKLVKQADEIVHAGDPDREGQLLVDEVIDFLNVSKTKKAKIQRLLISDLNSPAVKRALENLKPNSEFMPLSISALARSRADWLYGINLTRAYTLQGQKIGFKGVLSVGRVQTPLLGLVVQRGLDIDNFQSKPFYQVYAHLQTSNNETFIAKWQPSKQCKPYMDDENRVLIKSLAENVISRINNQPGKVTSAKYQQKKQFAPLPYNLSSLQIDAAKRFSMNAKLVLDVCQSLYEKHKLITYPRSDCRFLPNDHFKQAPSIIQMLSSGSSSIATAAKGADSKIKSSAWNDKKVSAHHAIIPTEKSSLKVKLNPFESNVYQLIVRQYLAQFYPPYLYYQTNIEIDVAGGLFKANAKSPVDSGWKVLFNGANKKSALEKNNLDTDPSLTEKSLTEQHLPQLKTGDKLHCQHGELIEKTTLAPQYFTDATLLAAMTGISRFVSDNNIKKILKETDGLGTEATRAGIIDLLFNRGFLIRQGKQIHATDVGKGLIAALPDIATKPDMTAQWEATLNAISEKQSSYQNFMTPLVETLHNVIQIASEHLPTQLKGLSTATKKAPYKKRRYAKKVK
ncbi:MAG: DNA topoisomerase III [Colwellia sp.]|nr:DNA topoisomerase III [Colwellia sp.]